MPQPRAARDLPPTPGVTLTPAGAEFCVYAGHASEVSLSLFASGDVSGSSEQIIPLTGRAYGYWFGHIDGIKAGQRYGFRADGPWAPDAGMRYSPAKLVLDPYARAIEGRISWGPEVFGNPEAHLSGPGQLRDTRDSAAYMPRCVVINEKFSWGADKRPDHSLADSLIYEVHVKNLTKTMPGVPEAQRGTYAGLAHPACIEYLHSLGVTAVELLPVHAFTNEPRVLRHNLANHWGYNTLGYFAPHAPYAAARTPQGVVDEFKSMVKTLHAAGIEVILDVVYNHTAEWSSADGPTLSWRGLDNHAYYRLDERGRDIDVTGCGNTVDTRHAAAFQMALDSMRYWADQCHVDGFRFDLAVATARGRDDAFDSDHPFLMAMRADPTLSRLKLIAEPWDLGIHGWRTGQFPPPFSEWNDRFRDTTRTFWLIDRARDAVGQGGMGVRDLGTRLSGSEDMFAHGDRGTIASINFVTAHDGFTLIDLTAYNVKHNLENREDNNDGTNDNRSWNHGVEGQTLDPAVNTMRRRSARNLLGTLFMASGVPMLNAGDEFGRTQRGNNNTYCQDNELAWFDWDFARWQDDLLATTRFLAKLRAEQPVLRQRSFFTGRPVHTDGSTDLAWYDGNGQLMVNSRWEDPHCRTLQMLYNGDWLGADSLLIVFHGGAMDGQVVLPQAPGALGYERLWDSAHERPQPPRLVPRRKTRPPEVTVRAASMHIYRLVDLT